MTDYSDIVPDALLLTRTPADPACAPRAWAKALLRIEDGNVRIIDRSYYGGDAWPVTEHNRVVLTLELASSQHGEVALDSDRLRDDLAEGGELAALIDRVIEGHSTRWDGNNTVGRLTEDAVDAADDIQQREPYAIEVAE